MLQRHREVRLEPGRKRVEAGNRTRLAPVGGALVAALAFLWLLDRNLRPTPQQAPLAQEKRDAGSRASGPSADNSESLGTPETLADALGAKVAQHGEQSAGLVPAPRPAEVEELWVRVLPARPDAQCWPSVAAIWIDAKGVRKRVEGPCDEVGYVALKRPIGRSVELLVTGDQLVPARHSVEGSHPARERALAIEADLLAGVQIRARDLLGRPLAGGMLMLEVNVEELRRFARELELDPFTFSGRICWECGSTLDARGEARVGALLPGIPYRARLLMGGGSHVRRAGSKEGAKEPLLYEQVLVLAPGELRTLECSLASSPLVGRVTNQHGTAVAGCAVQCEGYGGGRALTNSEGLFELCLVPEGGTTLHLWPAPQSELASRSVSIEVPPLAERKPIDLCSDRGLYLRGQLLGTTGLPARHGFVSAVPTGAGRSASAICGEDGSFVLGPLLAGRYELSGTDHDPAYERSGLFPIANAIEVTAGDAALVLRCE